MKSTKFLTYIFTALLILLPSLVFSDDQGNQTAQYMNLAKQLYGNQLEDQVEAAKKIMNNAFEFVKQSPSLNQIYIGVAANILGKNDVYGARAGLVGILSNQGGLFEDIPRAKSAEALGEIANKVGAEQGKEFVKPLGQCLLSDPTAIVRALCAQSLGETANSDALPFLYCGISDSDSLVQLWSAKAIIQLTGQSVVSGVACSIPKFAKNADPTVDLNQVILSATQALKSIAAIVTSTTTSK
jgi:hypothetical protein